MADDESLNPNDPVDARLLSLKNSIESSPGWAEKKAAIEKENFISPGTADLTVGTPAADRYDMLDLMWNQVDLNARTVRLNPGTTKNDAGQLVILDGELLETIQKQWERRKVVTIRDIPLPCFARLSSTKTESL